MIKDLHEKLINQTITSVNLTKQYLDNIKKKDEKLGAFLTVNDEEALAQAEEIDNKIKKGENVDLLAGIPGAVKDNICIMGGRTTAASRILDNYIAPYDATVIKKLKKSEAIILGKTNLDEFACGASTEHSAYKITKNPHDETRVPGGSSGGSTAAVAAQEAIWALGSDTGGSIRQPASFCGVVGLKPTYGRVSRYGLIAMASSLDQIGLITRTIEDAAIVLSRIAGEDKKDATSAKSANKNYEDFLSNDIKGKKIGVVKEFMPKELNPEIRELAELAIYKFRKLGAEVKEISLPHAQYSLPVYYIIMSSELSSNLARFEGIRYGLRVDDKKKSITNFNQDSSFWEVYFDSRKHGFGEEIKRRVMLGTYGLSSGYYDAYYLKAQKVRALIRKDFEKVFKDVDLIFSPTTAEVAFKIGDKTQDPLTMYFSDIYTATANLSGVPAISFPIGEIETDGKKLPVGGQLMAKWFDEEEMLHAAHLFEVAL